MIYTALSGGLGNQMFQYAFGRSVAIDFGEQLCLDLSFFDRSNIFRYSLYKCNIPCDQVFIDKDAYCLRWNKENNFILKCFLKAFSATTDALKHKGIYYCLSSHYVEHDIHLHEGKCYLYGWWQSEKYFDKHKNIIKKELQIKEEMLSSLTRELMTEIKKQNSVCLHYRKGDYKKNKNWRYQVCNATYFQEAIKYIKERINDAKFYIFSDDIEETKLEIRDYDNIRYIDLKLIDIDEFALMCACKHFIISNSTFSWWAQYLSLNEQKIVVAPRNWTLDGRRIDLYLNFWHLI